MKDKKNLNYILIEHEVTSEKYGYSTDNLSLILPKTQKKISET
jgi:hypothetical protein